MANVEHSTLTTTNLHENKGVSTASDNTVATAVSGATVWAKLTASNLTGTGNAFGAQLLQVREEQAINTQQGAPTGSAPWYTRLLNTTKINQISGASLSSNQITLPAGTFIVIGSGVISESQLTAKLKLYDVTGASDLVIGMNSSSTFFGSGVTPTSQIPSPIYGTFTLAAPHLIELRCSTNGRGSASNTSGAVEVYSDLLFWKVA